MSHWNMKSSFESGARLFSERQVLFDRDYFENGRITGKSAYQNYRWLSGLTIEMCKTIISNLDIGESETILDFGCAKGFMVKAFRMLGRECYGADISVYAIAQAPEDVRPFLNLIEMPRDIALIGDRPFDWVVAKDVLEHVPHEEIDEVLGQLSDISHKTLFVIPLGDGNRYYVPENELDTTHIIREDSDWWVERFKRSGWGVIRTTFRMPPVKERHAGWERGTGFFVLRSRRAAAREALVFPRGPSEQAESITDCLTPKGSGGDRIRGTSEREFWKPVSG